MRRHRRQREKERHSRQETERDIETQERDKHTLEALGTQLLSRSRCRRASTNDDKGFILEGLRRRQKRETQNITKSKRNDREKYREQEIPHLFLLLFLQPAPTVRDLLLLLLMLLTVSCRLEHISGRLSSSSRSGRLAKTDVPLTVTG